MSLFFLVKISCIVPVYNEAKRVMDVLKVLIGHELVDEVIVVNDGSTDNSEEVLRGVNGVDVVSYKGNKGKTHALKVGFERAKNDWVMTIDSDLLGLTVGAVTALIEPIIKGEAMMTLSLRKNSLSIFRLFKLDFVSGERVFQKKIIGDLSKLEDLPGFGFESFLNQIVVREKIPLKVVNWKSVITPRKSVKFGWWNGTKGDLKMVRQIISVLTLRGIFKQFWEMRKLSRGVRGE